MNDVNVVLLSDGELYDIIVDVVGDETSLEFCALSDYYLQDNTLDAAMQINGVDWNTMQDLVDEVEERAAEKRERKNDE